MSIRNNSSRLIKHKQSPFSNFRRRSTSSPAIVEPLEVRRFLSVSAATLAGPLTAGVVHTYEDLSGGSVFANHTETIVGPTTFNGFNVIEKDSVSTDVGDSGTSTSKIYFALTSAGLVGYGNLNDNGGAVFNETVTITPALVALPASMSAGTIYSFTATTAEIFTGSSGTNGSQTFSETIELTSATTQPLTVPAGTFNTYLVDVTGDSEMSQQWYAPGVGLVKVQTPFTTSELTNFSGTSSAQATHLEFTNGPTTVFAGGAIPSAITVAVEDSASNVVTTDNSNVTLGIFTGPAGAILGGTTTATAVNGVASFSNITLSIPGSYTLAVRDGSLTGAATSSFTVSPPGYIDTANMNVISGWAYDPSNPTASVNVEVVIVGGPTQTFSADQSRPDLEGVLGSSNHGFTYSTPVLSVGNHTAYIYSVEANSTKLLLATETLVSQNSLFDEHYYLAMHPNVAAAVADGQFATGYDHYIQYGQYEGYSPSPYWDEAWYLQKNPDVAAAVKAGTVSSGFMNYYLYGQYENRPGLLYFNTNYYLQKYPSVAAAITAGTVTSAFEHFVLYGQYYGLSPMKFFSSSVYDTDNPDILPFVTGETFSSDFEQFIEYGQYEDRIASNFYREGIYLADNPDVAAAVRAGDYPDGFQQWLEYGQYEGRTAV